MEEDPQISEEESEDREWIESLEYVIENSGRERVSDLLRKLRIYSQKKGVRIPYTSNTPYVNTIALEDQPRYPGDYEIGFQHFFRAGDERSRNYLRREVVLKSAEVFYEA